MADRQYIKLTIEDKVALLTIDHPPVNALSSTVFAELDDALNEITGNPDVRALVITGTGAAFVAGADIREFTQLQSGADAAARIQENMKVINRVDELPIPVIAAVNGYCLGGGEELALACDLRIASANARFGQPEVDLGIMPGWGGTQRLLRLIGPARTLEICLTGAQIPAQEALRMGLVNKVVPEGMVVREARNMARLLTTKSRTAVAAILTAVREGEGQALADGLAVETAQFAGLVETPDAREGISAFLEKRKPNFQ
jgi:enoyl-CoA hydratase/carnithine racemase